MNSSRLMHTLRHVVDVARGAAEPLDRRLLGLDGPVRSITRFDFRSARSRALALMMAEVAAMSPSGNPSPKLARLVAELGSDAVPMLFTGADLPEALRRSPGNRAVVHPRDVRRLRRALTRGGGWPSTIEGRCFMPRSPSTPGETIRARAWNLAHEEARIVKDLGLTYEGVLPDA